MPITHTFASAVADDPTAAAAGAVLPSHWNAEHDISLTKADVGLANVDNTSDTAKPVSAAQQTALDGKETAGAAAAALTSALAADITAHSGLSGIGTNTHAQIDTALTRLANTSGTNTGDQDLSGKQDVLVSATNIKTINGASVLGSGDLVVSGGGSGDVVGPVSSVNNRVAFFDGTTGKLIKDSGLTLAGSNTGDQDLSSYATTAAVAAGYQPLDSDLTAIAALTTTTYGRAFLALADAAAGRTALSLGTLATQSGTFSGTSSGANTGDQDLSSYATSAAVAAGYQPLDSDLTTIAGLTPGTSGNVLTSDGTNWTSAAASGGGALALIATLTPTAAANVDFLSTFSASYDNYLIVGTGLKPNVVDALALRLATSGVADATNNTYLSSGVESTSSGGTTANQIAISPATPTVIPAGRGLNFHCVVQNVNSASDIKSAGGKVEYQSSTSGAGSFVAAGVNGLYTGASVVTGFRLFWVSGNSFAANGKIRVYGYNNT